MTAENQKTPEGFAVELYFDSETEHAIRGFREKVYAAGVEPVIGKLGDRPHVSLAVFGSVDIPCLKEMVKEFALQNPPFPVILSAIGTFPTSDNVLFLSPVPTSHLLLLHRKFHRQLTCEHLRSSSYYHPQKWVPHCTIELELPVEQFTTALTAAHKFFIPLKGQFASMGIVSFRPVQYLAEYQFRKDKE